VDEEIARVQCIHMLSLARTHHGWIRRNDAAQSAESIYTAARRSRQYSPLFSEVGAPGVGASGESLHGRNLGWTIPLLTVGCPQCPELDAMAYPQGGPERCFPQIRGTKGFNVIFKTFGNLHFVHKHTALYSHLQVTGMLLDLSRLSYVLYGARGQCYFH